MTTTDAQGNLHDSLGRYTNKPGQFANFDLVNKNVETIIVDGDEKLLKLAKGTSIAVAAALLVSACGDSESKNSDYQVNEGDDNQTHINETDIESEFAGGEFELGDYYDDYDFDESLLEVGSELTPDEAEVARRKLKGISDEERAGRVVVLRDGQYVVAYAGKLSTGDAIQPEDQVLIMEAGRFMPVFLVNGQGIVWNPREPMPMVEVQNRIAALTGAGAQTEQSPMSDSDLERITSNPQLMAAMQADVPTLNQVPSEIALIRGTSHPFLILNIGGNRDTNGQSPGDIIFRRAGDTQFESREDALAAIDSLLTDFPNVIVHDMTGQGQ